MRVRYSDMHLGNTLLTCCWTLCNANRHLVSLIATGFENKTGKYKIDLKEGLVRAIIYPKILHLMRSWFGYIILFEFFIKRTAADPQFGGGFLFVPVALIQNFPEQVFFIFQY